MSFFNVYIREVSEFPPHLATSFRYRIYIIVIRKKNQYPSVPPATLTVAFVHNSISMFPCYQCQSKSTNISKHSFTIVVWINIFVIA